MTILVLFRLALPVAISIPIVLGFLGPLHPALDSFAHFRAHLAVLLVLSALLLLPIRGARMIALSAAALGVGAFTTTLGDTSRIAAAAGGEAHGFAPEYRLLQLNLRWVNEEPGRVLSLIGRLEPDVITFEEVSADWSRRIEPLKARYPYGIVCPRPTRVGGVAILSRRPLAAGTNAECHDRGAFATARIDFGGRTLDVAAIHLGWPWPFGQDWQIDNIAPVLNRLQGPAILAGDFNAAPWSHTVRRVAREGSLDIIGGVGPTWLHRALPNALRRTIGLPIDHIMAKGDVFLAPIEKGDWVGSDHVPLIVRFGFPEPEMPPEPDEQTVFAGIGQDGPAAAPAH